MKPTLIKKGAAPQQPDKAAPSRLNHFEHSMSAAVSTFKRQKADYNPRAAWRGLWRAEQ